MTVLLMMLMLAARKGKISQQAIAGLVSDVRLQLVKRNQSYILSPCTFQPFEKRIWFI